VNAMKMRHPTLESPPDTTVIWRYISLEKLHRLLMDKAIYFRRADLFDDPLEGILPGGTVKDIKNELPADIAQILTGVSNANRGYMFVSCWHANANESAAMWELYASKEKGMAIETTIGDLNAAITAKENYRFAKVEYVEHAHHSNSDGDIYKSVFIKSKPFSHEQEVRLVHYSGGPPTGLFSFPIPTDKREGMNLSVDVQALVKKIHLAPKSDSEFEVAVRKLLNEHSLAADIWKSKLYDVVNQFGPYG
jgi:hypothetical protein